MEKGNEDLGQTVLHLLQKEILKMGMECALSGTENQRSKIIREIKIPARKNVGR